MATVLTDNQHYGDIADAIRAKGGEGTFLPSEMAVAIAAIPAGGGFFHTTGTLDYRGWSAPANFSVPYTRPERNVIVTARCVGVWYKNENNEYVLSEVNDFSMTNMTSGPTVPLSFVFLSNGVANSAFTLKTKTGDSRSIHKLNSSVITLNPYHAVANPASGGFSAGDMTFSETTLSQSINNGYRFSNEDFGIRYRYHIFAWGDYD